MDSNWFKPCYPVSKARAFICCSPVLTPTEGWGRAMGLRALAAMSSPMLKIHVHFRFLPKIYGFSTFSDLSNRLYPRVCFVIFTNPGATIPYSSFRGIQLHQAALGTATSVTQMPLEAQQQKGTCPIVQLAHCW